MLQKLCFCEHRRCAVAKKQSIGAASWCYGGIAANTYCHSRPQLVGGRTETLLISANAFAEESPHPYLLIQVVAYLNAPKNCVSVNTEACLR
jgi:hypothetical protein